MSRAYWEPGDQKLSYKEKAEKYRAILDGMEFQNIDMLIEQQPEEGCRMVGVATKQKFLQIVAAQFQAMEEALDHLSEGLVSNAEEVLKAALGEEYKGPGGDNGQTV
jgi:hypothetical protein